MLQMVQSVTAPTQICGILGATLYVTNYVLLTLRVLSPATMRYFALNLAASLLVLSSVVHAFNVATLVIQVFFVGISVVGIVTRLRGRRTRRVPMSGARVPSTIDAGRPASTA
ncbi:hypothetical protein [uncultured Jannaschia sp.]|uniref:CBU_0592 family membrane protein n=1 Tax=uncultured Jannaschia sp. TaxID=293347 RepID=UPI00262EDFD7|nr:hypothetical protein [uncultured Jannaschia sp.]